MFFKKGAVTAFLIVGALLLILSGIVLFLQSSYIQSVVQSRELAIKSVPMQAQPLQDYITYCIEATGEEGLQYIAKQGWRYTPGPNSDAAGFPYFVDNGVVSMPSYDAVSAELSGYVNDNLKDCTSLLTSDEFNINWGEVSSKATITDNALLLDVEYPVAFTMGNFSVNLDKFTGKVDFNFFKVYNATSDYLASQSKHPEGLCISCMYDTGTKNELYFQYYTVSDIENEITIKDYKSLINNEPYTLTFAIRGKA